jgi:hypothetical protein
VGAIRKRWVTTAREAQDNVLLEPFRSCNGGTGTPLSDDCWVLVSLVVLPLHLPG